MMMMMIQTFQTPSAKAVASTLASIAATAVILRAVLRDHVPPELRHYVRSKLGFFLRNSLSSQLTLVFEDFVANEGKAGLVPNHLFNAAKAYLSPQSTRFNATLTNRKAGVAISMETGQEVVDFFNGVRLTWKLVGSSSGKKHFELSFHKKHKDTVLGSYLPDVLKKAGKAREEGKIRKLFTLKQGRVRMIRPRMTAADYWVPVPGFDHPSTFETVAMEAKETVMEDLKRFVENRELYRRTGRPWRRGYLVFGPHGTGKSSLVAAIANYLNFDVYDLDLSGVRSNAELRKLVISIGSRSVIAVEDVDCAGEALGRTWRARRSKVTLSGLLNFIDGLWSSCGDERIIVLTTSHKDRLDAALLRPGRMDVHVSLSYCTPCGFRMLASTFLGVAEHRLFPDVERLVAAMKVTPAEISEELLKNDEQPEASLNGLIKFLEMKKGSETETQSSV